MKKIILLLITLIFLFSCSNKNKEEKTNFELAKIYSTDKEVYDYKKSIDYFEKAVKDGETKAYYELGLLYMSPKHFYPKDYKKAKYYFDLALNSGDVRANYELGILEMKGFLGEKDEYKAKEYFEEIKEIDYLVRLYASDDSKIKDYKKAFEIASQNRSKENTYLNGWLGFFYENGFGVQKDLKKANYYYNLTSDFVGYKTKILINRNLNTYPSNTYKVTLHAKIFNGGWVTLHLPPNIGGRQTISNIKSNIKLLKKEGDILYFNIKNREEGEKLFVSFNVKLQNNINTPNNKINSWKIENKDYLSTPLVNTSAKQITSIAMKLKKGNDVDTLANIAYYTANAIKYKYSTKERSALYALKNNEGDCSESSFIFAALARNLGYPVKIINGFLLDGGFHMWNEVYTEKYGWLTYDSLNNYSSFHNGSINNLIAMGENSAEFRFQSSSNTKVINENLQIE